MSFEGVRQLVCAWLHIQYFDQVGYFLSGQIIAHNEASIILELVILILS